MIEMTPDMLAELAVHDWVLADSQIIHAHDIKSGSSAVLQFGPYVIDTANQAAICVTERVNEQIAAFRFVHDGWQIASARRFKPLIYFAVFGPDYIFDMLGLCLESICANGAYSGHVFILSDRQCEEMARYIPAEMSARTILSYRTVSDRHAMMMERFDISDLPIGQFQPVLCLDADMICDAPIMPMLALCNTAPMLFGSAEFGGATLSRMSVPIAQWFGRFLFEAAGYNLDQVYGLNGGAIAFPNQDFAVPIFRLVAAAYRETQSQFENFRELGEQPILNHALQTAGLIDARALNKFIQFRNQCLGTKERRGLMHFNYGVGVDKVKNMASYAQTLRSKMEYVQHG